MTGLVDALGGLGGGPPRPGVLHVVAVPRFAPQQLSVRAAVVVAGADLVRVPGSLPPDALATLRAPSAEVVAGGLEDCRAAVLEDGRVVVQLVPAAMQTAPALGHHVGRLREEGARVEVVASTGTIEGALVLGGVGAGIARTTADGRLDTAVLAADRPDLKEWRDGLARRGYFGHTPVRLITAAGTPQQHVAVHQLNALTGLEGPVVGPVVAVVGDDVTGPVDWAADLPLRGARVLNPRAAHQAAALSARIRGLGGQPVEAPLLAIEPGDRGALDAAVRQLADGHHELVACTSPNGVDALAVALAAAGLDARALAPARVVACVGPGTAARLWERLRVEADLVPTTSTTAELAAAVGPPQRGGSALLPRADLATPTLRDGLEAAGWRVEDVTAYRTRRADELPPGVADALAVGNVPLVPVLSSSMASALVELARPRGLQGLLVSIGPVTSATLRAAGVEPYVEASTHDLDGVVAALVSAALHLPARTT